MLINSLTHSPPPRKSTHPASHRTESHDSLEVSRKTSKDLDLSRTLGAMGALALTLAPQVASGSETVMEKTLDAPLSQNERDLMEALESAPKERLKVGDWQLHTDPIDLDLRPRWNNGPQIGLRAEVLESSLQRTQERGDGVSVTTGLRGRIGAEARTDRDTTVDVQAQAFRRWEGPLGEEYQGKFEAAVGLRDRLTGGHEWERGLTVAANFRQEVEGGGFTFRDQKYRWYLEGRQQVYHNLETGRTDADYRFMAGPKRDLEIPFLGKKRQLTIAVGPELKGSTAPGRDSFDVGLKVKLRARF